jgi:hypothetical protein
MSLGAPFGAIPFTNFLEIIINFTNVATLEAYTKSFPGDQIKNAMDSACSMYREEVHICFGG